MKRLFLVLGLAFWLAALPASAAETANDTANGATWILGKWELTFDPDGNPKDWLEFAEGGSCASTTPEGRRIPGRYKINGPRIEVVYSYNGKMIPVMLTFSDTKDRLLAYNEKTKHTAQYKKVKG